jgi:hypothetical protein
MEVRQVVRPARGGVVCLALLALAALPTWAQTAVAPSGTGAAADPYRIAELGHLVWMGDNAASSGGALYVLTNDIEAAETAVWNDAGTDASVLEGFWPIGREGAPFSGSFDGQGHVIHGLTIRRAGSEDPVGLFGLIGSSGTARHLGLEGGSVTGAWSVGSLVGCDYGTVERCYAAVAVTGGPYVGGLAGQVRGTVRECYATGTVTGSSDYVGGLVGYNDGGTVELCYATGAVAGGGGVGGLLGWNEDGTVTQCYATGAVTGLDAVGGLGLVGGGSGEGGLGTVEQCYWDTVTSGLATSAGGEGRTTVQMRQQSTYTDWDFMNTWGIVEGLGYPYQRWSAPPFRLAVVASGPGSASVDPDQAAYPPGALVALHAVAGTNGEFVRWIGPVASSLTADTTVTVAGHLTVVALFRSARGISSIAELQRIGNDPDYPLGGRYWLTQDVDASETAGWSDPGTDESVMEGLIPIGTAAAPFAGEFDGGGHVIRRLTLNRPHAEAVGLFGWVARGGAVRHLGMEGGSVTGGSAAGILVGRNTGGTVEQCYVTGAVTGAGSVGGLVGYNEAGTVGQCCATGAVTGDWSVGGLVGWNAAGRIAQCYATSVVIGSGFVGGLVGYNEEGTVEQCYWDRETSGWPTSASGEGRTTAVMCQQSTYAGWDFANAWGIVEEHSYPYLQWAPPPFSLVVLASGPGSVSVGPDQTAYAAGAVVTLDAAANAGSEFVRWLGPVASSLVAETTVTVAGHLTVVALFRSATGISSVQELERIGRDAGYGLNGRYWLTQDLVAAETATWNAHGTDESMLEGFGPIGTEAAPFTGEFDGRGHVVRGLTINRPQANAVGLFGWVGSGGVVRNLGLDGGSVTGGSAVGSLVGWSADGTITQCYAVGSVTGAAYVGGLVGRNVGGAVTQCYAAGVVIGADSIGGLVGSSYGTVTQCYAAGVVTGQQRVGGLVGLNLNHDEVRQCYATGAVTGADYVGGLVGANYGTAQQCYATGAVTGQQRVGGLAGGNGGTVTQCYWDTGTSGSTTSAGGIGKSTAWMRQQSTYAQWDFANVWGLVAGQSYPYLLWSPPPFNLTVIARGPGSVSVDPDQESYLAGTVVALQAVADAGCGFVRWLGPVASPMATRTTVTLPGQMTVVGLFRSARGISTIQELQRIGEDPDYPLDGWYRLIQDVDAAGTATWNDPGTDDRVLEGFRPIGTEVVPFTGTFDGQGHVIRGLMVQRVDASHGGLFGNIGSGGVVRDLILEGGSVTGRDRVGGLVGVNGGTVQRCSATGAVAGESEGGALVGCNDGGMVAQCYGAGEVTCVDYYAGGLVGSNYGTVMQCYAAGIVTGLGCVGGLVGHNGAAVEHCYASGMVTGTGGSVGGLLGDNEGGTVQQCYATGAVTGGADYVGGLVGVSYGETVQCYWDTETSGWTTSAGGEGMTTAQMRQQATYEDWDFTSTWGIVEGLSYPYLEWSPPPFILAVVVRGPGSVFVDPDRAAYPAGTAVVLHAVASVGGEFVRWSGPVASPNALDTTVTVAGNLTVEGLFRSARGISSIQELQMIGRDPDYTLDGHYWLTRDVDAAETAAWGDFGTDDSVQDGFGPIGTERAPFTGELDGRSHVILRLTVNRPETGGVGLFGWVGSSGAVRRLGLVGGSVTGESEVGGLVGVNDGTIEQCYATGAVTGGSDVGGLVGGNGGTVGQCYATGAVTGDHFVGGLVGGNSGTVEQCYWDTGTSGWANSSGGDGRTTAQMRQQSTFADWDFATVWGIAPSSNNGYPHLRQAAVLTLSDLMQTYDGSARSATVTTVQPGLTVTVTYDGEPALPVHAGTYAVVAAVTNPDWGASATGTLTIAPRAAAVRADDQTKTYGTADPALTYTVLTGPVAGDAFSGALTRDQGETVGRYSITQGTLSLGPDYDLAFTPGTMSIGRAAAAVTLGALSHVYDGAGKYATVTTDPADLAVAVTYDGVPFLPIHAGTYAVVAAVTNPDWEASATGTLTITPRAVAVRADDQTKAYGTAEPALTYTVLTGPVTGDAFSGALTRDPGETVGHYSIAQGTLSPGRDYDLAFTPGTMSIGRAAAAVALGALVHVYDGAAKHATVITDPADLAVTVTYGGGASLPVNAGTYVLVATVTDPNWEGTAAGMLTIARGIPIITWPTPAPLDYGLLLGPEQLSAAAGVPGSFVYVPAAGSLLGPGSHTLRTEFAPVDDANWAPAVKEVLLDVAAPDPGTYLALLGDVGVRAGHGLWDFSGNYATTVAGQPLRLTLVHDSKGKVTGTGAYSVGAKEGGAPAVPVALMARGTVMGVGGAAMLKLVLRGDDSAGAIRVSLDLDLTLDAASRSLTGPVRGRIRTGVGIAPVAEILGLAVPPAMDGTWRLLLEPAVAGRTVTGHALLTLSNGADHYMAFSGRLAGDAMALRLAADATAPGANGIRIRATITPLTNGVARMDAISGSGYGQVLR